MNGALTNVLTKVFVHGFYKAHAGIFLFIGLLMFGAVPPDQLINYHKALMIGFLTSPQMLAGVFAVWLLYALKTWHYAAGQLSAPHNQFLFYSLSAYSFKQQFISWFIIQLSTLMPIFIYGLLTISVGLSHQILIASIAIAMFLLLMVTVSAYLSIRLTQTLPEGKQLSLFLRFGQRIPKPYFSLFIWHIANQKKLNYAIVKLISWAVITAVFALFADVEHDARVAGIAVLAIVVAHVAIVFEERVFEETYLRFGRSLPYSRTGVFGGFMLIYLAILMPEIFWLYVRFSPLFATQLMFLGLSIVMLFHCLLYKIGLNMDNYLQWVLGLFMILFWVIMFKAMLVATLTCFVIGFALFYKNYYRSFAVLPQND